MQNFLKKIVQLLRLVPYLIFSIELIPSGNKKSLNFLLQLV